VKLELFYLKNIRNPGGLRRFDQGDLLPGLTQHSAVKKLQAIKVELDRTPGKVLKQVIEIIEELVCGQVFDSAVQIVARKLPGKQLRLVQAWIELHRDEFLANWELATGGDHPYKIKPL